MASNEPTAETRPPLPDGLVAFVKKDCPTCELVAPALEQLARATPLHVYSQDDPAFPKRPSAPPVPESPGEEFADQHHGQRHGKERQADDDDERVDHPESSPHICLPNALPISRRRSRSAATAC